MIALQPKCNFQIACQTDQLLKKFFFVSMVSWVTKLLLCDQGKAKLSLFIPCTQVAYQTEQVFKKIFFDSTFCLESDKIKWLFCDQMTA